MRSTSTTIPWCFPITPGQDRGKVGAKIPTRGPPLYSCGFSGCYITHSVAGGTNLSAKRRFRMDWIGKPFMKHLQFMADLNRRLPQNVRGQFYVDDCCIYCDLCVEIAPAIFKEINDQGWAVVFHQPSTEAELALAIAALESCPTESIGRDGELIGPGYTPNVPEAQSMPDQTFEELYRAIKRGGLAEVRAFFAIGGSANLTSRNGWSLLMASARYGQSAIATELLNAGRM